VCHKTKPILGTNKAETFLMAPNGGRICLSCVRNAELSDMAAGRISMVIDYAKEGKNQGWYAVTPSGNARFPLIALPGWNDAQILANPSFMHEGIVWSGRLYKTGRVAFQKTTVATTAPGLPLATRKARARKSQATAAI
jgi:hypothetical protein